MALGFLSAKHADNMHWNNCACSCKWIRRSCFANIGPGRRALRRMRQRSQRRWWVQQQVLMFPQRRLLLLARLTPLNSHQQIWQRRSGPMVRRARCAPGPIHLECCRYELPSDVCYLSKGTASCSSDGLLSRKLHYDVLRCFLLTGGQGGCTGQRQVRQGHGRRRRPGRVAGRYRGRGTCTEE